MKHSGDAVGAFVLNHPACGRDEFVKNFTSDQNDACQQGTCFI
jgi:hypothetical protein